MRVLLGVLLWLGFALPGAAALTPAVLELRYKDSAGHWREYRWQGELEIADTPALRERGLMYRGSLAPDRGMLFVYPDNQDLWFWMKDTTIALTAVGFDPQCRVVSARPLAPLSTETVWLGRGRLVVELPRVEGIPDLAFGSRQAAGALRLSGRHAALDSACQTP